MSMDGGPFFIQKGRRFPTWAAALSKLDAAAAGGGTTHATLGHDDA